MEAPGEGVLTTPHLTHNKENGTNKVKMRGHTVTLQHSIATLEAASSAEAIQIYLAGLASCLYTVLMDNYTQQGPVPHLALLYTT